MDLTDVLQMLGRAGRPQFDTSGIARIFTQDAKKAFYKHFLHTGFPVESSLHMVLSNHLGAEISAETVATKQDALDYLTWTFFFRRLHKNPTYYGLEIPAEENTSMEAQQLANDYIVSLVSKSLDELEESGCIKQYPNGDIDPTPYGKIMSYYYLSHKTIKHLLASAKRDPTFADVLGWLSLATEFDELPVRHNEDLINAELSKNLPLKADHLGLPMWDPHVKAFLLLQAHFERIELPISDYVGDLNSVLDQSIRVCQAMIDILAELGYSAAVRAVIGLMQCVKSARWVGDGPLAILPGVQLDREKRRVSDERARLRTLNEVVKAGRMELEKVGTAVGVKANSLPRFHKAASQLPDLTVRVSEISALGFSVHASRTKALEVPGGRMYAPAFPKPQTEGFFLLVSRTGTDELIALKRVNWPSVQNRGRGSQWSVRSSVKMPQDVQEGKVDVRVVSDGYIGLEWWVEEVEIPAAPRVEDMGKKEAASKE
jgi:antiviral helicase SLH1